MFQKHAEDQQKGITWSAVSGVQPIVFVARVDDKPIAIIEKRHVAPGFQLTTCAGETVGDYASLDEGMAALDEWMAAREY